MGVWCLGWLQAVEAGVKFSTPGVGQEVFTYWVIGCVLVVLCFPTAPCLSLLTTESGGGMAALHASGSVLRSHHDCL